MSSWPDWDVSIANGDSAITAPVQRLSSSHIAFEWYRPEPVILTSQVLKGLRVRRRGQDVYVGAGVVVGLMPLGNIVLVEVRLDEPGLKLCATDMPDAARHNEFQRDWQNSHLVSNPFKLACVNLHNYLTGLRSATLEEEVRLLALPASERTAAERALLEAWAPRVIEAIDRYRDDFEDAASAISTESRWPASVFVRRLLSPLFLSAPFGHRTFYKPLGYAGDFEMMGMIMRNTFEGETLYAKFVHYWMVQQWAALSVRNRIAHLERRLMEEALRARAEDRIFRVLNIGCGPAWEVQSFIRESPLANRAEFTLVDFESNAMRHVLARTAEANAQAHRKAQIKTVEMSVNQLLKESLRSASAPLGRDFDMIYCVGLFDYLPLRICQQLTELFHTWTRPRGLTLVANMKDEKPYRHMIEYLLDWHLIYRSAEDIGKFAPASIARHQWSVVGEELAVNLFLEIRKSPPE